MAVYFISQFFEVLFAFNQAVFYFFAAQVYEFAKRVVMRVYVVVAVLCDFGV